jgi:acetyl-CoA carboxylase biotin carboxylase subunit
MNTRVQVGTQSPNGSGIDIVQMQIRVAAGEKLLFTQRTSASGHASVRISTEDPTSSRPAGRISMWRARQTGCASIHMPTPTAVPPNYDSMISKIIVRRHQGATLARMRTALSETVVEGIRPTSRCTASDGRPKFIEGGTRHYLEAGWPKRKR